MYRASCVSRPLRSAKRALPANIHKSTDSLRLPRFRTAALIHSHTRTRFVAQGHEIPAVSPAVHDSLRLPRKTMRGHAAGHTIPHAGHAKRTPRARFPTLSRDSARATSPMATIPHTCHAKRTRSNVKMHDSPHLPSESTAQCPPKRPRASGVPRPPRETSLHTHARDTRCHDPLRLPRETSIHTHARDTLHCSAQ